MTIFRIIISVLILAAWGLAFLADLKLEDKDAKAGWGSFAVGVTSFGFLLLFFSLLNWDGNP